MAEPIRVSFRSGGVDCAGYLYRGSVGEGDRAPCVVLCHGFGGTQDTPAIRAAARAFANAGFAALTFDYRNFGESGGVPRQLIRIRDQHEDIRAAVAFARGRAEVDAGRIALWGTSLGGGHVVAVAADDPRIAAVVAQMPFNGFPRKVEGRSMLSTLQLLGAMMWDMIRGWLGLSPYYIPAVGGPDELAVMASPQAQQAVDALDSAHWRNEIAPRVLFEMLRYRPGDAAHGLAMPVLVCIAEHDRETPPELARVIAERAPRGELKTYPIAHFDLYRPDVRAQVIADQVAFLRRVL